MGVIREAVKGIWAPFLVDIGLEIGMASVRTHVLVCRSLRWAGPGEAKADAEPGPEASPVLILVHSASPCARLHIELRP